MAYTRDSMRWIKNFCQKFLSFPPSHLFSLSHTLIHKHTQTYTQTHRQILFYVSFPITLSSFYTLSCLSVSVCLFSISLSPLSSLLLFLNLSLPIFLFSSIFCIFCYFSISLPLLVSLSFPKIHLFAHFFARVYYYSPVIRAIDHGVVKNKS